MSGLRIAVQLYTVREFMKTPEDTVNTLKRVKEIGYDAVQVSGTGYIDREKAELVKKAAEELGLEICATHVGFDQLESEMDWMIELHRMWNCRYVGLGAMPDRFRGSREGYVEFAGIANGFGKVLSQNGLRFIYHNHNFEFHKFDGMTGMQILLAETDPEYFDFEIDTYWVQAGGADPIEWIRKLKGRMDVIHFKDMVMYQGNQTMAEVGEGNLNWNGIIEACRETGVKWAAVEQDICLRDPFESLGISLRNLEKYGCMA
ncbi:MAG TPA: sugar phosphate isomerase/epimerase [Clostridia bacterium]